MKRNRFRRFFQQKQYAIASLILFAAIAAMTGVYFSNRITSERQEEEMAQKEAELSESLNNENKDLASLDSDNIKNTDRIRRIKIPIILRIIHKKMSQV